MKIPICIFFCLIGFLVTAQKPHVKFLADSVEVGKEIKLSMSYLHSSRSDIVFPDSSYDFSPFIYVGTEYFETRTSNRKSLDSVIYTLVTYQIDSVQWLRPYVKNVQTNQKIYADTAKVTLRWTIAKQDLLHPNPHLTLDVIKVNKEINIPKFAYIVLGILGVVLLIIQFFGEWIVIKYRLWKFDRQHKNFISDLKKQAHSPHKLKNQQTALIKWKEYLELLDKHPVSTMSTSEIHKVYNDSRLENALNLFDMAIFGGVASNQMPFAYIILQDFATKKYRELRNAKLS